MQTTKLRTECKPGSEASPQCPSCGADAFFYRDGPGMRPEVVCCECVAYEIAGEELEADRRDRVAIVKFYRVVLKKE